MKTTMRIMVQLYFHGQTLFLLAQIKFYQFRLFVLLLQKRKADRLNKTLLIQKSELLNKYKQVIYE